MNTKVGAKFSMLKTGKVHASSTNILQTKFNFMITLIFIFISLPFASCVKTIDNWLLSLRISYIKINQETRFSNITIEDKYVVFEIQIQATNNVTMCNVKHE
jgi:hypothetical protein